MVTDAGFTFLLRASRAPKSTDEDTDEVDNAMFSLYESGMMRNAVSFLFHELWKTGVTA
jgi:hypothetical protein